jgi:hypothetical protein
MRTTTYLHWVGWSVILSGISMILSVLLLILALATGSIAVGTHSHSVLTETFDVLTTGFLLPLPFGFYLIYKTYATRLSFLSTLVGTITLLAVTVVNVLFVFEVLWFSDPISQYLYAGVGVGLIFWLLMVAYLANRSRKPAHGTLLNILGATIVGIPIWVFSMGYLLISGKLSDQPAKR